MEGTTPKRGSGVTSSRDEILSRVKAAIGHGNASTRADDVVLEARIAEHAAHTIPKRGQLEPDQRVELFKTMAEEAAASISDVPDISAVPDAIADYLSANNLPAELVVSGDPDLGPIDWSERPTISVRKGKASPSDLVGVTGAFAAIAETGTLMLASGPNSPTTLNLLPDNHIVILTTEKVMASYEEAWDALRKSGPSKKNGPMMPRTVCFITGPSRSADIEQTLLLGAHGPRRLHIVLVNK